VFDILGRHQSSIFLAAEDITPTPETISALLKLFNDKGFLPSTYQEIGGASIGPQIRLRLNSPNNEWLIDFDTQRIDIQKRPISLKGQNIGDVETFVHDVEDFFSRILSYFKKKGHRLSLATSGLLPEMSPDQLETIYTRLFNNSIAFYDHNRPFDWKFRLVSKVATDMNEIEEEINVITNINRIKGQTVDAVKFDRIEIAFDINTTPENKDTRFEVQSLNKFYNRALFFQQQILDDLRGVINGRRG
jgi:hypothetical protein